MKKRLPVILTILACIVTGAPLSARTSRPPATDLSTVASGIDSIAVAPRRGAAEDSARLSNQPEIDEESLDVRLFRRLNGATRNPLFDVVMPIATDFRRSRVAVILVWAALVIFGGGRGRWAALMLIPIIAASDQISSHLLKPLVERMRPCEVLGSVHFWHGSEGWIVTPQQAVGGFKTSFSFPSSHAANITSSMIFLALVYRRWIALPLAIMALVSFSRIYIGVHWPSDVAAGMALGAILAAPAYLIFERFSGHGAGKTPAAAPERRADAPAEME